MPAAVVSSATGSGDVVHAVRTPAATTSAIARGSRLKDMSNSLEQGELETFESSEGAEIMRNGVHILTATILVVAILLPTFSRAQLIIAVGVCGAVFRGQFLPGAHERCVETRVAGRADRGVDSRYFNSVRRNLLALCPLFPLPAHTWHGVGKH